MERLNGELSKLAAANKQFEKANKDLEAAQRALEKRASGSESALKQAQSKLKSAEDAAAAGQKLLESVRRCSCLFSGTRGGSAHYLASVWADFIRCCAG